MVMNDKQPDFYLAATDVHRLDAPMKAWRVKSISRDLTRSNRPKPSNAGVRDDYLLIRVYPPFQVRDQLIDKVLLSAKGTPIAWFSIDRWQVFVYVLNPQVED